MGRFARLLLLGAVSMLWIGKILAAQESGPDSATRAAKLAPPDAAAQAKARQEIRELFRDDYAKKSPADRLILAQRLRKQAEESRSDTDARFVLLRDAADVESQAGDFAAALADITELGRGYSIDVLATQFAAIKAGAASATRVETARAFVQAAARVSRGAAAAGDADLSVRAAALAESIARGTRDAVAMARARAAVGEAARLKTQAAQAKAAEERLRANSQNAQDSLTLGRYLCFVRGDWNAGLPLLAHGSDARLSTVAKRDLHNPPAAKAQKELGDAWWDLSARRNEPDGARLRERAAFWYAAAAPSLEGLDQALAKRRVEEVASSTDPGAERWISKSATYVVSSQAPGKPPLKNLLDGSGGGYQNNGFAFHTTEERNPWIVIDLNQTSAISRIEIANRRDDPNMLSRARSLTVWVSETSAGPWKPVWTATDVQPEWDITLPGAVNARYVKIGLRERGTLHLYSVKVFGS